MERKGLWLPESKTKEIKKYKLAVMRETRKWTDTLFEKWDGRCYYTGDKLITTEEWLKDNKGNANTNKLQPTIDHKISINFGIVHNIDPKTIGGINNLCICSRSVNSIKNQVKAT